LEPIAIMFYRCPHCSGVNFLFRGGAGRQAPRAG
jgi:hypothetical protein